MKLHLKKLNQQGFDHVVGLAMFIVIFAGIGSFLLVDSHALTPVGSGSSQLCTYNGHCLNASSSTVNPSTGKVTVSTAGISTSKSEHFFIQGIGRCNGKPSVTSTCPFANKSLDARYLNDETVQIVDSNYTNYCLTPGSNDSVSFPLGRCNNVSTGSGGADGTVYIMNTVKATSGYLENIYYSNLLPHSTNPNWLCVYPSVSSPTLGVDGIAHANWCQWKTE